ncbi:AMP-binding protein [Cupriavidus sp. CuC1]|uniref:AMP-binding protein n=1 Tax=Cupriavidus sp. CuC1 TaxID=3373131 RepID=UPI0037CD5C24
MNEYSFTNIMTPLRFGFPEGGIVNPSADTLPLQDRVAAKLLARQAQVVPDRPFVFFRGQWLTYGEADARANQVANAFAAQGIRKGMRVGILLRNRLEFLDLWFGLSRLGAIQVPLNPEYRAPQLAHVLQRAPIEMVIAERDLIPELQVALSTTDRRPKLMTLGAHPASRVGLSYESEVGSASAQPPAGAEEISGADPGAVMNTSGTTGPSKGVLLSHAQQYVLARTIAADMDLGPGDVFYNFFPLFHNTAQAMITIPVLMVGARMVLTERFSASRFWPEAVEYGCTAFYYIGEIMHILLKSTTQRDATGSRLRIGWGIGTRPNDFLEFQKRFQIPLRTGYGSTEANVPCVLPRGSKEVDSAGRAVPGFEIRIANELGEAVPAGVQGEILVRADEPFALMLGYDGDPPATVAAWQHLWLHTGDAATMSEDGDIDFKGRVKDAVRVRGENISAFEIEQAICELPEVAEVAAIAVPGELGGDDLKIVVVKRDGAELTPEDLIAHAQSCLPRYSIPRYVEFVNALPKTATNKVQKHVLRSTPFTPTTWDRTRG